MHEPRRSLPRLAALLCAALFASVPAHASDTAKEKRWAEQIADQIIDGGPVWLEAGGHKFLAIYTEATGKPAGAVVVMHGIGVHPDWAQVVNPLRVQLPQRGWTTLSIQLPILPNEASFEEYLPLLTEVGPRIDAALKFLKDRGVAPVFLVAHSLGATMAGYYLAQGGGGVRGIAAIGMSGNRQYPRTDSVFMAGKLSVPMLDLYGSDDLPGVLDSVAERKLAGAANKGYRQVRAEGANHFFAGHDEQLVKIVGDWLDTNVR